MPVRGWFGEADNAELDPGFAARLENLWWRNGLLRQRPGYALADSAIARQRITHALTGGAPQTIVVHASYMQAGTSALARATPGRMMAASLSNNTLMVDGVGPITRFNGTALDLPAFTGTDLPVFDGVIAHHDRAYFWRSGGPLDFWYGGLGAVQGALTKFPLGRLGNIEGGIACMGRFTSDAGENVNDLLVILTTAGDVVIYQGTDPGLADDWRIWGRLKLAPPVSRYAMLAYGPDLLVLTTQGIASIGAAMGRGTPSLLQAMSQPIKDELAAAVTAYPASDRWQMIADPGQQYIIVSTPQDRSFVFGTEIGGWYHWTALPALNWRRLGDRLMMTGTDGREFTFGGSTSDDGALIRSTWWSAWVRGVGPHVATLRPVIFCPGDLTLDVAVLANHATTERDLAEFTQTVTIPVENPGSLAAQPHDEPVLVGVTGDVLQLRLSFEAAGAEITAVRWTG